MMRRCPACGAELVRRTGEKRADFHARKYCNFPCSVVGRPLAAEQRRIGLDVGERDVVARVEFDRAEILRVAHRTAPQVPVTVLADVLDQVTPLIASNTRRALMSVVATRFGGGGITERDEKPPKC